MKQPTYNDYKRVELYAKRFADALEQLRSPDDADAIKWVRQWEVFARNAARELEAQHQAELEF